MIDPRLVVVLLTVAAFALPTLAAVLAFRSASSAITRADFEAREHERIYLAFLDESARSDDDSNVVAAKYENQYAQIGYPAPTYTNAVSAPMHATARAVRAVLAGAKSNAWLALIGLACGLAASLWSLYLAPA